jgi:hypothetical protein
MLVRRSLTIRLLLSLNPSLPGLFGLLVVHIGQRHVPDTLGVATMVEGT